MGVEIRQVGGCFGSEVTEKDLTETLSTENVKAIHDGMDKYAVLTFRKQPLTAEQQLAFSKQLGSIEHAIGTSLREDKDARFPSTFADVSNLDKEDRPFDINDRRRLFAIGNRLWHSDSSFKVVPAKHLILHAISIPSKGGNTEFLHMPSAYDGLEKGIKEELNGLICEHSHIFSRQQVGFTDFTDEKIDRFKPVRQTLIRKHPATGRKSLYLSSHAGRIDGLPVPDAKPSTAGFSQSCFAAKICLCTWMAKRGFGYVG